MNEHATGKTDAPRKSWLRLFNWDGITARDARNERRANAMAMIWTLSLIVCGLSIKTHLVESPLAWLVAVVPLIPGVLFARAYLKYLREADEFLRKIQMEALATGFGAGLICGTTVVTLTPPSGFWGMAVLFPMVAGYIGRVLLAAWRVNA
jgi:hypothetical protein